MSKVANYGLIIQTSRIGSGWLLTSSWWCYLSFLLKNVEKQEKKMKRLIGDVKHKQEENIMILFVFF